MKQLEPVTLNTGVNITLIPNSKSYKKYIERKVTRIEVESKTYDDDIMYHYVTLDTDCARENLKNVAKPYNN